MLTLSSDLYASTNNEFLFYGSLFVRTIIVPTIYNCSEYIATIKKMAICLFSIQCVHVVLNIVAQSTTIIIHTRSAAWRCTCSIIIFSVSTVYEEMGKRLKQRGYEVTNCGWETWRTV